MSEQKRVPKYEILRQMRKRKRRVKIQCPICKVEMKRKGKKGRDEYFKCPKCKGKLFSNGIFKQAVPKDSLDIRNYQLKEERKEIALRKLIRRLKKEKYLGYHTFQWEGKIIDLNDYDVDGISFAEKKEAEEARKKQEEELKQKQEQEQKEEGKQNVS